MRPPPDRDGGAERAGHRHPRKHDPGRQSAFGDGGVVRRDRWERLPGSFHGSGCTLASAIAACIANGAGLEDAVRDAQDYTWQTLANAFRPGMGQFIPDRLFWARDDEGAEGESGARANPGEKAADA